MHGYRAGLVLGLSIGALIQPAFAIGGWLVWQRDMRRAHQH
jgi:hypothetical protein